MRRFVFFFVVLCVASVFGAPPKEKTARVVLFKQGLGYVEKVFTVEGNVVIELQFDESQVPDVLNSLVVVDKDGGIISDIEYDSKTPREKLLGEIFGGRQVSGLVGALSMFKGAEAEFSVSDKKIVGRIFGVEQYQRSKDLTSWRVSVITRDGTVTFFDISEISSFKLIDPSLQKDLTRYLRLVAESFKRRRKTIRIHCKGKGKREILVAYTIEIPVWKTTHRFVLKRDKALCQSWAVVDNTTLEDWKNVEMVLISGVPVVFKYDLYSPVYTRRRELRPRDSAQAPPQSPAAITGSLRRLRAMEREERARKKAQIGALKDTVQAGGIGGGRAWATGAVIAAAAAGKLGCFFAYKITHPITVRSKQSAMIPIISRDIPAERLLYIRYGSGFINPYQAVRVENKSDVVLDAGPASVFEEGTFLGNAMLPRLEPGQKGLVCYALEQGVEVQTEWESLPRYAYMLAAQQGYITVYFWQYKVLKIRIKNHTPQKKHLVFDYPTESRWNVVGTKPKREGNFLRFEFDVAPKKETVYKLKFRTRTSEYYALNNFKAEQLELFVRKGWLSKEQRKAIREIIEQRRLVSSLEERLQTLRSHHSRLVQEQGRLRANLMALRGETQAIKQLRARYIRRLVDSEDEIQKLLNQMSITEKNLQKERNNLQKMIHDLVFKNEVKETK